MPLLLPWVWFWCWRAADREAELPLFLTALIAVLFLEFIVLLSSEFVVVFVLVSVALFELVVLFELTAPAAKAGPAQKTNPDSPAAPARIINLVRFIFNSPARAMAKSSRETGTDFVQDVNYNGCL